jgi:hypothetical protein
MIDEETISEINEHISDALREWSDMMSAADAVGMSHELNYTDEDLLNALKIFTHVAQNVAIKNDYYHNEDDLKQKINAFKNGVKIGFDFDTVELTKKVLQ